MLYLRFNYEKPSATKCQFVYTENVLSYELIDRSETIK